MSKVTTWSGCAVALLLVGQTLRAEIKVVVERNDADGASAAFKFEHVPPPARDDFGTSAAIKLLAGEPDGNGGEPELLIDGHVPDESDQPSENFFFAPGEKRGRLEFDLGAAVEVRQVNSYSWHPDTRGPQLYTLYASDGTAEGFNQRPGADADLEKAGWKRLASVDTRSKDGPPGGQYGVSITDSDGPLGKFRYLLFDIASTNPDSSFGNTFYNEIDVVTDTPYRPMRRRGPSATAGDKFDIMIDYSEMPELKDWVETKLRPTLEQWYPIIVNLLPSEGYVAPRRFSVTFRKDKRGVADTGGTRINCAGAWFKANLEGEAVGAVVHELVHVVQRYGGTPGARNNPGWLVEGVADYVRWFKYEPASLRPRPNPNRAKYTDSYRTTAAFLEYVATYKDHEIVVKFNAAMRAGKYRPELWKEYTGQTVDELWDDYIAYLRAGK